MTLRLGDLPPKLRAQVEAADPKARKRDRTGAGATKTDGWCFTCGERFTSSTRWERHSDESGHRRFVLLGERTLGARK